MALTDRLGAGDGWGAVLVCGIVMGVAASVPALDGVLWRWVGLPVLLLLGVVAVLGLLVYVVVRLVRGRSW